MKTIVSRSNTKCLTKDIHIPPKFTKDVCSYCETKAFLIQQNEFRSRSIIQLIV